MGCLLILQIRGRLELNKYSSGKIDYSVISQDNFILEHYGLNELNLETVKSYRQRFTAVKPDHPWNGLDTKEFLYKIGAWGKLRDTNKEGLTLAGLLMFSEERIITEVLPQYFLEYRESSGAIESEQWSKRFTSQDGTWSGNVYDFYFKTMASLIDHASYITGMNGLESSLIQLTLHETLMNAIVHADYYGEGGIVVEKENEIVRFSNPGLLRTSVEQVLEGGISNLRNPNLFKMFILIDLCKRAGSSLKNINIAWKQHSWPELEILQDAEIERTMLALRIPAAVSGYDSEGELQEDVGIPQTELEYDMEHTGNSVNNDTNSYNNTGHSYNNEYNSVNIELNSMNNNINPYNNEYNSVNNDVNSYNNGLDSVNNDAELYQEALELASNEEEVEASENFAGSIEAKEIEDELWSIAELARKKKRLSPSVMEQIILELCEKRPLMLKELAYLLERTPDGLRNNYLTKLLSKGKIRLKYPDQINHPKQAYMIVK